MSCFRFLLIACSLLSTVSGFHVGHDRRLAASLATSTLATQRIPTMLHASGGNEESRPLSPTEIILENERRGPNDQLPLETTSLENDDNSSRYPLNFPSPLLLSSSILLSIVSTGSLFMFLDTKELTNAIPSVVGFPIAIFLFYAAITKAIVETEEDDRKFLSENK